MDFAKIRNYLFLGLLLLITVAFILIIRPFIYPLFWAAVIAALFYPLYKHLDYQLKSPNLSTLLTLMLVVVIIILPLTIIALILTHELMSMYDALSNNRGPLSALFQQLISFIRRNPYTAQLQLNQSWLVQEVSALVQKLTQNTITFAGMFILMIYTLFYFIRDGEKMLHKLMFLLPLGDKYELRLYQKFTSTARATIKGTLLVGGIQGIMGGLLFYITGIPGALIWGIIMVLLSVIPATGSFFIWLPAGIIMLSTGHVWQGVTILLAGTIIISTIDNFLRPILVGKDLQMHPVIVLFATLGGLFLFGVSGFVIGPIVAAVFFSFWEMYEHYYHSELMHN